MNASTWLHSVRRLQALLEALAFSDAEGRAIHCDEGFELWRRQTEKVKTENRTVFLVGNGASASMASHMAADLAKNAQMHTEVFSDLSLITAVSNDMGYEHVFSEPLSRRGKSGDMLVAISSSGASANVLSAARTARELSMFTVTLSAMAAGNPLRSSGELNIYLGCDSYGEAESCHAVVLHRWMDLMEVPDAGRAKP